MILRHALGRSLILLLFAGIGTPATADDKPTPPPKSTSTTTPLLFDIESPHPRTQGGGSADSNDPRKYRDFAEVTAGATHHEGLYTLFQKEDHLYAEIKPFQFDQPVLAPITIARGLMMAGNPLNFGDEWVLVFHRAGDKVQLIRRNIHVKAPSGTPIDKAVRQNYTDSVLMALPIVSLNPAGGMSVLIDLSDIFFTNFAQLPLGYLDRSRTNWAKVKTFANNIELEVQATFSGAGGSGSGFGDEGIIDNRGVTIVIHYSLVKLPDAGYHPRNADDRVGHYLNATKDFGVNDPDGNVVRSINRWRLEKADPRAKLSPPKKQIVWYIEDTVPIEYRPYVEDGIREWNKAFEKIGFRDALSVRWQEANRDEFDPEDINYCTFRWIATSTTYAMSCLRSNPITGEMIDGDVIFDASWVRAWKTEYAQLTGTAPPAGETSQSPVAVGEVISSILASKRGFGELDLSLGADFDEGREKTLSLVPAEWSGLRRGLLRRMANGERASCRFSSGMKPEMGLAVLAMAENAKGEPEARLPEEFLGQLIKETVMHEVGHSLGLRHNFKASTMLDADQLNNQEVTRVKGLTGSVMDYNPINIAPKGQKQGDYITSTIGPYDYWAIEYAYKEVQGDEAAELKKVAARAPEHDLVFANETDMMVGHDPLVNVFDLGSDPCRFAKDRLTLAAQLMKDLDANAVKDGESWSRLRIAFSYLMGQYGNAAELVASHVGGQSVSRHHKGDKDASDPIVPIAGEKQRAALAFLVENVLGDKPFQFSPALLRRLSKEHWDQGVGANYWGQSGGFSVNDRVLAIQKIALSHCLSGSVLARLQDQELQSEPGSKPLAVAEVFRSLTDGIFAECNAPAPAVGKSPAVTCSTIRRNLQREYIRRLTTIVLGQARPAYADAFPFVMFAGAGTYPADARALARLHLKEIAEKIGKVLNTKDIQLDDACRAHLDDLSQKIGKVLNADISSNEP